MSVCVCVCVCVYILKIYCVPIFCVAIADCSGHFTLVCAHTNTHISKTKTTKLTCFPCNFLSA